MHQATLDEITSLTEDLIRFRTTHEHPAEIRRCADFVEAWLDRNGIPHERRDEEGLPTLTVLPRPDHAPVLLLSHLDVVDAPDALFEPLRRDGRLHGRGSIDDKYAVALSLILLRDRLRRLLRDGGGVHDLPLGLLITGDEEIGGFRGTGRALETLGADFAVVLDGGAPLHVVTQEKGILRIRLEHRGRAAHGSRPWLGQNAVEGLMEDLRRIQRFFPLPAEDPNHWHRTLNIGVVRGGTAPNQVPEHAEALLDVRYTETDDVSGLMAALREQVTGELVVTARAPVFTSGASPFLDRFLESLDGAVTVREHGGSDARFLPERGIPGVVWGADGGMSQHGLEEHVDLKSLGVVYDALDRFLNRAVPRGASPA